MEEEVKERVKKKLTGDQTRDWQGRVQGERIIYKE